MVKEIELLIEVLVDFIGDGLILVFDVGKVMNEIVIVVMYVIDIMGEIVFVLDE